MKEYADGYPKEAEIRKIFMKQRRWETFKKQVMEEGAEMRKTLNAAARAC
jgi:hypothetical protein